jgi:small conductance mechanosensitive channel
MRKFVALLGLLALSVAPPLLAQDEEAALTELQPLPEDAVVQFNERLDAIGALKDAVDVLEVRLEDSEGLRSTIYAARLETVRGNLFGATLSLAKDIASQHEKGFDVAGFKEVLLDDLRVFPEQAIEAMDRLGDTIRFNYEEMGPRETVVNDRRLLLAVKRFDLVLDTLVTYTEVAAGMGLDASQEIEYLDATLSEAVANRSVFLEVAIAQVGLARTSATTLPGDAELPSWVLASEARVRVASEALQSLVTLMNRVDMDTRQYRQQVVTATGALTTDVLDVGVIAGLIADWSKTVFNFSRTEGPRLLFSALLFVLILFVFSRLSRLVRKVVEKAMLSGKVEMSHLLKRMVVSTAGNLTFFIGILFALSQVGISLGPLLAGLGIAGFIIGFALQDSLSNFASGMMILMYRPFDVGDYVEAGGVAGKVDRMSLVNTTFKTFDNQVLVVPNNLIWQSVITNVTAQHTRRVDLTFGISYSDDIDKAKAILREVVDNYDAVLKNPEPNIRVAALGESSVDLLCRPWVQTDDYWDTYWNLTEIVKKRFDEEGITIPFPQRDVHMIGPEKA